MNKIRHEKETLKVEKYLKNVHVERVRSTTKIRERLAWTCIGIVSISLIITYGIIILCGLKIIELPESFLHWLGASTIGTIISNTLIVFRHIFPVKKEK